MTQKQFNKKYDVETNGMPMAACWYEGLVEYDEMLDFYDNDTELINEIIEDYKNVTE